MHGSRAGAEGHLPEVVDRRLFDRRVGEASGALAVVVVNLVTVNLDDAAIAGVEEHVRRCVRGSDLVGRLSPRQLAFTCPADVVDVVIRRVRAELDEPIRIGERVRLLTFTVTHAAGSPSLEDLVWRAAVESHAEAEKLMHELFSRTLRSATTLDELGALMVGSGRTGFGARRVRLVVDGRTFEDGEADRGPDDAPDLVLDVADGPGQLRSYECWSDLDPAGHPALVSALRAALAHQIRRVLDLEDATRLAHTDPLTGVPNRAGVLRGLAATSAPVAVAMIDLDRFKSVNDRLGHDAGDRVLVAIGTLLLAASGPERLVGRWGGEEFVVAVPGGTVDDLVGLAEDLRRQCRANVAAGGEPVTMSVGVAEGPDFDEARARADRALYEAKASGRDRVAAVLPPGRTLRRTDPDVAARSRNVTRPTQGNGASGSWQVPRAGVEQR